MRDPAHPHAHLPAWIADVIAAVLVVAAGIVPFPGEQPHTWSFFGVGILLASALVLPLRRRWPVAVVVATIVLYAMAAFSASLSPGTALAAAIAMFGASNRFTRRAALVTTASTIVAVLLISILVAMGDAWDPRAIQFAISIAFAAAAGDATRSRREYIIAVTERAERAEQSRESEARRRVTEERLRIARDLHDTVAHQISVISLNAGVASSALESRPEKATEALRTIRSAARRVLGEIADLLELLRADEHSNHHAASPQPGLGHLDELVAQFAEVGLVVNIRVEGELAKVTGAVDLVAYRVIQEGLTNAHKHGAEQRAHVLLVMDERDLHIVVTNPVTPNREDRRGHEERPGGHGLLGLRERVLSVRGSVETGITPGGYRVAAVLPLSKELSS